MSAVTAVMGQITDYRRLLAIRDYRLLWSAQVVSAFGDKLSQIALATLVYETTGSEVGIGIVLSIAVLPRAVLGLFAGSLADRISRKTVLIATDLIRAVIVLALALWAGVPLPLIYLLAALHAAATVFFTPARYAVLPDIVPRDDLMNANTLDETTQSAIDPLAYLIGGALVAAVGVRSGFGVDSITFLASALLISLATTRNASLWRATAPGSSVTGGDITAGLRALFSHPVLRANTLLLVFAAMIASADLPLIYMLAFFRWSRGALGLGILEGGLALGFVAGALLCRPVVQRIGKGHAVLLGLIGTGFAMTLVAVLPFWPAVMVNAASGIFNILFFVPSITMSQELAPSSARAGVLGSRSALMAVGIFLSYAMATVLTSYLPAASVLAVLGLVLAVVTAVAGALAPTLRVP